MKSSYLLIGLITLFAALPFKVQAYYSVVESTVGPDQSYYTAILQYYGDQPYYINETNEIIQSLNFTYFFADKGHLIVRLTDPNTQRWEVPYTSPFPHVDMAKKFSPYDDALVQVNVTESPFSFKVTRKQTSEVIFDSSVGDFIYSDLYLELSTSLATPNIYGLGERAYKLNLGPDGTYTLFNKENPSQLENGTAGNNLYGYHPVYLLRESSNDFNMVLLRSSSPMDVLIEGGQKLTYKVVGGVIDLNFFVGDDNNSQPETVVQQYHKYLGGWTLQPFWAFGFHQSKWGYHSAAELHDVLGNYSAYGLPLDVIWSDIDYMDHYIDFTVDPVNFAPSQMKGMLKEFKKRWVPIIDAGVALNNTIYDIGYNSNVFVHDPDGKTLIGDVWPGNVSFPDFLDPNTSVFWDFGLGLLYKQIPFSGIWTDMNEVSSFVSGEVGWTPNATDLINNPPYVPNRPGEHIYTRTMRMDAVHYGGVEELYIHNMFGFFETKATFGFLKKLSDLVFILSRSTFYGSGQYAAHWTGDNAATYDFMAASITGIMDMNLFGIPLVGSDICGFDNNTTPELCSRWFQVGALYPFSRDHSADQTISQEPYALGATVLETARVNLAFRYSIVRHYYTQFLKRNSIGTIFRPVFFEFPTEEPLFDSNFKYTDSQFLVGESLMAAPALKEGQQSVDIYFPKDTWFDYNNGSLIITEQEETRTIDYPAPFNATAPLFMRSGYIIPTQNVTNVMRTDDLSNQYQLVIAYKKTETPNLYQAQGELVGISSFEDSNVYLKCREDNCLYGVKANITVTNGSYQVYVSFSAQGDVANYERVEITGLVMMGDWEGELVTSEDNSGVIRYTLETPFVVSDGEAISVSSSSFDVIDV